MKKTSYNLIVRIPLAGAIFKMVCDPMIGCSPSLDAGFPEPLRSYAAAHPDIFITKRLLKKIMSGRK